VSPTGQGVVVVGLAGQEVAGQGPDAAAGESHQALGAGAVLLIAEMIDGDGKSGEEEGEVFLGRQVTKHKHISDDTFNKVDSEIRIIIDTNYDTAYKILEENRDILDSMAAALVEFETIDTGQIDDLMARKPMREAAEVVDSEEVSSELGTGSKTKGSKPSSDDNRGGDSSTEQFA